MKKDNIFICGIIGFVSLLVLLFYIHPQITTDLFNTLLGNILLLMMVIGVGFVNIKWAIGLASIIIILNQSFRKEKEGFFDNKTDFSNLNFNLNPISTNTAPYDGPYSGTGPWSADLIQRFTHFEETSNPLLKFDIDVIQSQANPSEVKYLLKNGYWPWSSDIQKMYQDAAAQSFTVRGNLGSSMNESQKIYSQTAMLELLSWNTKEGTFLLLGATISNSKNMPNNVNNVVRCSSKGADGHSSMEKVIYTGYDSINGSLQSTVTPVKNEEIPLLVNGFKFVGSDCNPCMALDDPANYSCPFSLNTGSGPSISPVWQKLWGLPSDTNASANSSTTSPNEFPLLNELKKELEQLNQ